MRERNVNKRVRIRFFNARKRHAEIETAQQMFRRRRIPTLIYSESVSDQLAISASVYQGNNTDPTEKIECSRRKALKYRVSQFKVPNMEGFKKNKIPSKKILLREIRFNFSIMDRTRFGSSSSSSSSSSHDRCSPWRVHFHLGFKF